jgi:hypothetical protein
MQRSVRWLAVGVIVLCSIASAPADEQAKNPAAPTCETHGTSVHFDKTPSEAAKRALKEEKLVMVLHISGIFEDPNLT